MFGTHPPVYIWPRSEQEFYKLENYFYGIYPEKPLRAWRNDELAAWVFGFWASQAEVRSNGISKLLLSEFWFRAAAIEAEMGLTPGPEVEIYHDEDTGEDYEHIEEIDPRTLDKRAKYLPKRPHSQTNTEFFCPENIYENIEQHFKERILLAEAVFTTRKDSASRNGGPSSWSDQLLMDVLVMVMMDTEAEFRRNSHRRNSAITDLATYADFTKNVLEVLVSRGKENEIPFQDVEFARSLLSERANLQEDLFILATGLLQTTPDSELNATLFDRGLSDDCKLSLHEFVEIMKRTNLSEKQRARLMRVEQLSQLTYPHIPDLAPFSVLFALITQTINLEYVDVDKTTTQYAVESLFEEDVELRMLALADDCVLARTAVALGERAAQLELIIYRDHFESVHFAYPDAASGLDVYRDGPESRKISISSTECLCVPGYTALENFLTSRGMFAPAPAEHIKSAIRGRSNGYWSSLSDLQEQDGSLARHDGFSFTIKQTSNQAEEYVLNYALGEVFLSLVMQQDYPTEESKVWIELWEERTDMVQYVLEASAHNFQLNTDTTESLPARKIIWTFLDVPEEEHDPLLTNQVLVFDPTSGNYSQKRFDTFAQGFYFTKGQIIKE